MQKSGVAVLINLKETWQPFEFVDDNYIARKQDNMYSLDDNMNMRRNSLHIQVIHSGNLEKLQKSIKLWNFYYNLGYIMYPCNRVLNWYEGARVQQDLTAFIKQSYYDVVEVGAFLDFYGSHRQLAELLEEFVSVYSDPDLSISYDINDVPAYPAKVILAPQNTECDNSECDCGNNSSSSSCKADTESQTLEAPLVAPASALCNVTGLAVEDVPLSEAEDTLDAASDLEVDYVNDDEDDDDVANSIVASLLMEQKN